MGWKPLMFMTNVSVSGSVVISRRARRRAVGLITSDYRKDQSDPAWADDPGMKEWRDFMAATSRTASWATTTTPMPMASA